MLNNISLTYLQGPNSILKPSRLEPTYLNEILSGNKSRFKCGSEIKKRSTFWGLRKVAPPTLPSRFGGASSATGTDINYKCKLEGNRQQVSFNVDSLIVYFTHKHSFWFFRQKTFIVYKARYFNTGRIMFVYSGFTIFNYRDWNDNKTKFLEILLQPRFRLLERPKSEVDLQGRRSDWMTALRDQVTWPVTMETLHLPKELWRPSFRRRRTFKDLIIRLGNWYWVFFYQSLKEGWINNAIYSHFECDLRNGDYSETL